MLAHNVRKRSDVDTIVAQAQAAGAEIVRAPKEFSWGGYGGVFKDPDHHLWEGGPGIPHDGSGEPD